MDAFSWNPYFVTGLERVDEQHHHLVDLINAFGQMVMRPTGADATELDAICAELARYAEYHFAEEEELMRQVGVDPRHVEEHVRNHRGFINEVTRLHASRRAEDREGAQFLLRFLTHWLAYHILGSDQMMAKQIAAIESGVPAEEAYRSSTCHHEPSTEALLTALNGLFQQISERNRALEEANQTLEARVAERTQALQDANQRLEDLANTDVLTGLPNRRYALRHLAMAWEAAARDGRPLTCMMIDADGFKDINDTHGHAAGDAVLRALARQLSHAVRTDDMVARLGGDEFLIVCDRTPLARAMTLAESLRQDVARMRVPAGEGVWSGSISVGVAAKDASTRDADDLIRAADAGVYQAKRGGRNQVASSQASSEER